jgi:thiol-disulfide isomerase/thioredoxin
MSEVILTDANFEEEVLKHKGPVMVDFWATWCGPCKQEMPELQGYMARRTDQPIMMVAISADEKPELVDDLWHELKLDIPVGIDTNNAIGLRYDLKSYPPTVMIGLDGRIALYQRGAIPNAEVVFEPLVKTQRIMREHGVSISRAEYEQRLEAQEPLVSAQQRKRSRKKDSDEAEVVLEGRALDLAARIKCPSCGKPVTDNSCGVSRRIRAKLRDMNLDGKTDEQIVVELFLEGPTP